MSNHEEKQCPRCKAAFECKAGSIAFCQCSSIALSAEEREYIKAEYDVCLCLACLNEKKLEHYKQSE